MKIDQIDIFHVAMPLVSPFRTAFGNDDCIESVLVRLVSDGIEGWGEAAPWKNPSYSSECAQSVFLVLRDFLARAVLGQNIDSGIQLQEKLLRYKGNYFAKAALDLAWWDLSAKSRNMPLYRLLGGKKAKVTVGADFGVMDSIDLLLKTIDQSVKDGFERVKLKYRPGWELDMLRAVRKHFPKLPIHVDCNSAYTLEDLPMLRELDQFDLVMIEQPLSHDDLIDHATLQSQLRTPICLDESITSPANARKAIQIGACRWVNIKPGRVGGITPAVEIHDICEAAQVGCWIGGMLESSVGAHHCLALGTLSNIKYPSDIFPTNRFYQTDLSKPEMALSSPSTMTLSEAPGCGASPDRERLAAHTVQKASL